VRRLNGLLDQILPENRFYAEKLARISRPVHALDELAEWPWTLKEELIEEATSGLAANRTFPLERYVRYHRTSGTHGRPLVVLDTAEDWRWWSDTWQYVLDAAEVRPEDRAAMAFSFGPFIGFWSAYEALTARGAMVIPCGGMSSLARVEMIGQSRATLLCCTPSYALHLSQVASDHRIDLRESEIRAIIVAGEPGGSIPTIRDRIEQAWGARLIDHAGASEVGPWGYADPERRGLRVVEWEFIAEFRSLESGGPARNGELSELVLTTLGRVGSPVIRYRTGDVVRPQFDPPGANRFVLLEGGVLGRVDDMLIVRGVNVYPSAIEQIVREFPEIAEYRLIATKQGEMDALTLEIEDPLRNPQRVAERLQLRLGLRVAVDCVEAGSLPRFEHKGRRFVDKRK
jgi:phenylacetate-CoA ligase